MTFLNRSSNSKRQKSKHKPLRCQSLGIDHTGDHEGLDGTTVLFQLDRLSPSTDQGTGVF